MSSSASSRRTAAPAPSSSSGARGGASAQRRAPGLHPHRDGPRRDPRPAPAAVPGRRARPHERPGVAAREAVAGRRGAARGRDRRHLDRQRAAPREPQRRRRAHHRCDPARDGPRRGRARRRPDRARRHVTRGAAATHGPRQHLPARAHRRRALELLPPRQPRRAAGARAAVGRRPRRGEPAGLPGAARDRRVVGDARARHRRGLRRGRIRRPHPARCPDRPPGAWRTDRRARRGLRRSQHRDRSAVGRRRAGGAAADGHRPRRDLPRDRGRRSGDGAGGLRPGGARHAARARHEPAAAVVGTPARVVRAAGDRPVGGDRRPRRRPA